MMERLLTQGATPKPSSPEKLDAFVKEEISRMARLVQAAGIKVE
jgi:tripartite-type tricarboxylate transporter receptor subunit TctC